MERSFSLTEERTVQVLIFLCPLIYLCGWQIPLMEVDAVQYANLSREMLQSHHFLQLFDQGKDYLDKPPMLFWLSSCSMFLFGVNDVAYRLPSFLFAILSLYSTYKFVMLYYNKSIALLSTLVLASCQAMFLITHDVRTDTMLMGWVTLAIWQWAAWFKSEKKIHFLLGTVAIAGGMMTKGPIALMVPIFAFLPHFLLRREFKQFFRKEYLIALLIIGVLLIPMCIGLYQQYDLHPEKMMYQQKGISGLRFFFWTQSFGRITGESTWHENASFFFLFQNMLWGFLPWTLFFVFALVQSFIQLVRSRFFIGQNAEWISSGGFIVTYCALASSRAQLPHYIYVVFPMAAVMTGKTVYRFFWTDYYIRWKKPFLITHVIIFSLLIVALFLLLSVPFPPINNWLICFLIIIVFAIIYVLVKKKVRLPALLIICAVSIIIINIFIDSGFYPLLLQYQMGVRVSEIIRERKLNRDHFFVYNMTVERNLSFYSNHSFDEIKNPDSTTSGDYLLTNKNGLALIDRKNYKIIFEGEDFHVSMLSLEFLNPATRGAATTGYYILQRI